MVKLANSRLQGYIAELPWWLPAVSRTLFINQLVSGHCLAHLEAIKMHIHAIRNM